MDDMWPTIHRTGPNFTKYMEIYVDKIHILFELQEVKTSTEQIHILCYNMI